MTLIHNIVDVNKDLLLHGPSSFDLDTYLQFYTKKTHLYFYLHIIVIQLQVI